MERQVRDDAVDVGLVPAGVSEWRLVGKAGQDDYAATYLTDAVRQIAVQRNAIAAGTSMGEPMGLRGFE
ncbi:hypothetical protein ACW2Q0_07855 [Nocardia sp. R16R-3T]